MSQGWSRRALVDALVGTEAVVEFTIPLTELPRVSQEISGTKGDAQGRARFVRRQGQAVAELSVRARPEVICQRCMQPMYWQIDDTSQIALVRDHDAADRVPAELEVFLVEGDSVSVRDLVDEEIMLALPHVPLHDEDSECAGRELQLPGQGAETDEPSGAQVQKPFAQLSELLKRK